MHFIMSYRGQIIVNVGMMTRCERGSLFLRRGGKGNAYLVSKLFDVTETSTLEENLHTDDKSFKVPFGIGIVGTVAQTKQPINIPDAYQVQRISVSRIRCSAFQFRVSGAAHFSFAYQVQRISVSILSVSRKGERMWVELNFSLRMYMHRKVMFFY